MKNFVVAILLFTSLKLFAQHEFGLVAECSAEMILIGATENTRGENMTELNSD